MKRKAAAAVLIGTMAMAMAMVTVLSAGCANKKRSSAAARRPPQTARFADERARNLADAVLRASGAPRWGMVRTVSFRFVHRNGENVVVERRHVWDVPGGIEVLTREGKSVRVDVANPDFGDPAVEQAVREWKTDIFWLLAPLMLADAGVTVEYGGSEEMLGKQFEVLRVRFEETARKPAGAYKFYIDPLTSLVQYAEPLDSAEGPATMIWAGYRNIGPFKFSTLRRFVGDRESFAIEDLRVEW